MSTDNGKIPPSDRAGEYYFVPDSLGHAQIFMQQVTKADTLLLGVRNYRVKPWPKHFAQVSTSSSGEIKINVFKAQSGTYVPLNFGNICGTSP
ncbi:MAG: hypothetical protein ACI81P_002640 [Neolewinella sp.]